MYTVDFFSLEMSECHPQQDCISRQSGFILVLATNYIVGKISKENALF